MKFVEDFKKFEDWQTTSTMHKIILPGNFGKERRLFKQSSVSLIQDFTPYAKGCRWKSKNADILSG